MLAGELDAHPGYEKHSCSGNNSGNSRNGSFPKKIQTEHGESTIRVPRDRNGDFSPVVVPKHESRFPHSTTRICVVHQIRNSCKYVVWKDMREFTADMREIYISVNREQAASALSRFERKWGSKYRHAVQSRHRNWDDLTAFFDFPVEIRTIIYTTNLIENLNGKIRKYTKTTMSFPADDALRKSVWLALQEIEKKWIMPIKNWGLVMNQFIAIFENRIEI